MYQPGMIEAADVIELSSSEEADICPRWLPVLVVASLGFYGAVAATVFQWLS